MVAMMTTGTLALGALLGVLIPAGITGVLDHPWIKGNPTSPTYAQINGP
jgi:hypothetical protein